VASPQLVSSDEQQARHVLELTDSVPAHVWGRDEFYLGEMWNSNSVISWLLASAGLPVTEIHPPANGRAPGWSTGVIVARRSELTSSSRTRKAETPVHSCDEALQVRHPTPTGRVSRARGVSGRF
jgi:hypothetical protein